MYIDLIKQFVPFYTEICSNRSLHILKEMADVSVCVCVCPTL